MSQNTQLATVKSLVAMPAYRQRFDDVLGKDRAAAFLGSLTALATEKSLAVCNPQSVLAAAFTAATLDLPIQKNLGFAWVIPYKGMGQFQMGYKGYIQLALRTGQYVRLNAFPVNAEAVAGRDEFGEFIIDTSCLDDNKPAVGFAVAWQLMNGFKKTIYWPKEKCMKHAARFSQSFKADKKDSPWFTDEQEMCLKTVTANGLKKWGPLSVQMEAAYKHDQGVQMDVDAEPEYPDGPQTPEQAQDVDPEPEVEPPAPEEEPEPEAMEGDQGEDPPPSTDAGAPGAVIQGKILDSGYRAQQGKKDGWKCWSVKVNGDWYSTFDRELGPAVSTMGGQLVEIRWEPSKDGKYRNIIALKQIKLK